MKRNKTLLAIAFVGILTMILSGFVSHARGAASGVDTELNELCDNCSCDESCKCGDNCQCKECKCGDNCQCKKGKCNCSCRHGRK